MKSHCALVAVGLVVALWVGFVITASIKHYDEANRNNGQDQVAVETIDTRFPAPMAEISIPLKDGQLLESHYGDLELPTKLHVYGGFVLRTPDKVYCGDSATIDLDNGTITGIKNLKIFEK